MLYAEPRRRIMEVNTFIPYRLQSSRERMRFTACVPEHASRFIIFT